MSVVPERKRRGSKKFQGGGGGVARPMRHTAVIELGYT